MAHNSFLSGRVIKVKFNAIVSVSQSFLKFRNSICDVSFAVTSISGDFGAVHLLKGSTVKKGTTFGPNFRLNRCDICLYSEKYQLSEATVYWRDSWLGSATGVPQFREVSAYFQIHAVGDYLYGEV